MTLRRVLHRSLGLFLFAYFAATPALATGYVRGYLVDSVSLPTTPSEAGAYAIDLNGDGNPDNNFGGFLAGMNGSFDMSSPMSAAVTNGSVVHLLSLHSTDPVFTSDPAAQTDWYVGQAAPTPPLFDGTDDLPYDSNYAPGIFVAALSNGGFTSVDPVTTAPVSLTFMLQFGPDTFPVPMHGARLSFTTDHSGHMQGQLNGSIKHDDYMLFIPQGTADMCNAAISADPNSNNSMTCKQIYDKGGSDCGSNSGSYMGDGVIEVCELTSNAFFQTLLLPDVQIYQGGVYDPNPANTTPDSNSFGVRFTAIASPDRVFANGFDPP